MIDRASAAYDFIYRTKGATDYFMSSASGAGYINPSKLRSRMPSFYPSGVAIWQKHCKDYYSILDYNISGWLLNGSSGNLTATDTANYAPFSGRGIGVEGNYTGGSPGLAANAPVLIRGGYDNPTAAQLVANPTGTTFAWYRYILYYPYQIKAVQDAYPSAHPGIAHRFLDLPTFYYLLNYSLGGNNHYRESWVTDTAPRIMRSSTTYDFTVTVRNDGWDTWSEALLYRLGHAFVTPGATPGYPEYGADRHYLPGGATVAPGQSHTFNVSLTTPSTPGNYDLFFDMVRDGVTWFFVQNNNSLRKQIIVAANETDIDSDADGIPDVTETAQGSLWWHPDSEAVPPTGDITIDYGNAVTFSPTVTLSLSAADIGSGVSQMRFYTDAWSGWQPFAASAQVTLPAGFGSKTVLVEFNDLAGNTSLTYSDSIIYTLKGDFDGDQLVNLDDLAVMAGWWLSSCGPDRCQAADMDNNGMVGLTDFAQMMQNW